MATSVTFTKLGLSLATKKIDISADTVKCMLMASFTPARDTMQFLADALAAGTEVTGTGYTAGGQAVTSLAIAESGHVYTIDCDDVVWNPSTLNAPFAIFYDDTPSTNATKPLLAYWDASGDAHSSTNAAFTVQINASGLVTLTAS